MNNHKLKTLFVKLFEKILFGNFWYQYNCVLTIHYFYYFNYITYK